ncbi:hypothetical protein AV530_019471 [Patagioenas fasciata monilis]|uniref:Uncharacterized protein n=1 Tax=Patagioenas fasciata monilis TaxID=372326 RepID=A0A1V4JDB4_PATFA|nr:hypothetical protein AV530_019471 [Patagioenas fasciata monilis]
MRRQSSEGDFLLGEPVLPRAHQQNQRSILAPIALLKVRVRKNNRVAVRSVGCLETERTSWLSSSNISDASKQQPGVLQWHQDLDQHWEPQRVQVLCMRMMVSPSGEGKYFSGGISHHLATGGANTASISNAKHKSVKGK